MAESSLREMAGIETSYGLSKVLFGMSLAIAPGEMVTLMGRNGMGKTTTVRSIMGLTPPRRGRIGFKGTDVAGWGAHRIGRLGLGLVPEGRQVFPTLTVRENLVATAANRSGRAQPWTLDAVYDLFPRLRERQNQLSVSLSGGEQQMLAVARALMAAPRLLLLDEPSIGLAPTVVRTIGEILKVINRAGVDILLVEQNSHMALRLADHGYVVENGRVVMSGPSAELLASDEVRRAYLGI